MSGLFLTVLNMSISASWVIIGVLVLRLVLKRVPKWIAVLLWGVAGLRLAIPFSVESVFSLIPSSETITKLPDSPRPFLETGFSAIDKQVNNFWQDHYFEGVTKPAAHFFDLTTALAIVWIVGMVLLFGYALVSYLRLRNKVSDAERIGDRLYRSGAVVSPFVLGVFRPRIYLPARLTAMEETQVIAHEEAHLCRKDHWWKPLGFLLLSIHWFNPLIWLGYLLLCRDIELACDQKVIRSLQPEQRADYSQTLLNCSINRPIVSACPLAFGEVGVKSRVKSVLSYKKPAFWVVITAVSISLVFAVCFLTNPPKNTLNRIEGCSLNLSDTVAVTLSDGETFFPTRSVDPNLLEELGRLPISRSPISQNRNENRRKTHTVVLQDEADTTPSIYSYVRGIYFCFNDNFTEVWMNDSVKPTLSYQVLDPDRAKAVFDALSRTRADLPEASDESEPDDWGVSMEVIFRTDTKFEAVFKRTPKLSTLGKELITGEPYEVRAVLDNGETMPVGDYMRNVLMYDYLEKEMIFTTVGYLIKPYQEVVVDGDLEHYYGTLPPGNYLLCKEVSLVKEPGKSETRVYSAPFRVDR